MRIAVISTPPHAFMTQCLVKNRETLCYFNRLTLCTRVLLEELVVGQLSLHKSPPLVNVLSWMTPVSLRKESKVTFTLVPKPLAIGGML
jgi:hypothetical protein